MNTELHQGTTGARGFALGLLLMTALAVGTTQAGADDVTAYAAYPEAQLAEQRLALEGSMQRTAKLAQRALAKELKLSLKLHVRTSQVAAVTKAARGQG